MIESREGWIADVLGAGEASSFTAGGGGASVKFPPGGGRLYEFAGPFP
jgi:hypothetical protein